MATKANTPGMDPDLMADLSRVLNAKTVTQLQTLYCAVTGEETTSASSRKFLIRRIREAMVDAFGEPGAE